MFQLVLDHLVFPPKRGRNKDPLGKSLFHRSKIISMYLKLNFLDRFRPVEHIGSRGTGSQARPPTGPWRGAPGWFRNRGRSF